MVVGNGVAFIGALIPQIDRLVQLPPLRVQHQIIHRFLIWSINSLHHVNTKIRIKGTKMWIRRELVDESCFEEG